MKPPMSGWFGFAAIVLLIIGGITFFEGVIAIVRDEYYVVSGSGVLLFDLTTWGWLMVVWSIVLIGAGFALSAGASWGRWLTIVLVSVNVLGQLAFAGSVPYPLWGLTVIALNVVVLYALIARWEGYPQEMGRVS